MSESDDRTTMVMIGDMSVSQPSSISGERLLYGIESADHNIIDVIEFYPDGDTIQEEPEGSGDFIIQLDPIFAHMIEPPIDDVPQYNVIVSSQGGGWATVISKEQYKFTINYINDSNEFTTIFLMVVGRRRNYNQFRLERFWQEKPHEVHSLEDLSMIGKGGNRLPILEEWYLDLSEYISGNEFTLENHTDEENIKTQTITVTDTLYGTMLFIRTGLRALYNFNRDIKVDISDPDIQQFKITIPASIGVSSLQCSIPEILTQTESYHHNWSGWTMDSYYLQMADIDLQEGKDNNAGEFRNHLIDPGPIGSYQNPFNGIYESRINEETEEPYKIKNLFISSFIPVPNLPYPDLEQPYYRDIGSNAFFGAIGYKAKVANVRIENAYVQVIDAPYAATFCSHNRGEIISCHVTHTGEHDNVIIGTTAVGGLIAENYGSILQCSYRGSVIYSFGNSHGRNAMTGGLCSNNYGNISLSYYDSLHSNTIDTGQLELKNLGVLEWNEDGIFYPYGSYVYYNYQLYKCIQEHYSNPESNAPTETSYWKPQIIEFNERFGNYNGIYVPDSGAGLCFLNLGRIERCYVQTSVYGYSEELPVFHIGGLVGVIQRPGMIYESYVHNNEIIANNGWLGGFIGQMQPDTFIENCYAYINKIESLESEAQFQAGFCAVNFQGSLKRNYAFYENFKYAELDNTPPDPPDDTIRGFMGGRMAGGSFVYQSNIYLYEDEHHLFSDFDTHPHTNEEMKDISTYLNLNWNIATKDNWIELKTTWFIDEEGDFKYPQLAFTHPSFYEVMTEEEEGS